MLIKSALITAASGSIGGLTASHNKGGQYFRSRVVPVNSNTEQQQVVRNHMKACVAAWTGTLTQAYRDGWTAYAEAVGIVNALGDPRKINGLSMFMGCNVPRLQAGLTRVDVPPTTLTKPTFTAPVYTVTAPSTGSLAYTNTDGWATAVGGALLLYTAKGTGVGVNYFKGPYRYAGKVSGAVTPPTSPASIAPAFSVTATQKVNYRVLAVMADGRISAPMFLVCTAS